jgi:hypothetical protein
MKVTKDGVTIECESTQEFKDIWNVVNNTKVNTELKQNKVDKPLPKERVHRIGNRTIPEVVDILYAKLSNNTNSTKKIKLGRLVWKLTNLPSKPSGITMEEVRTKLIEKGIDADRFKRRDMQKVKNNTDDKLIDTDKTFGKKRKISEYNKFVSAQTKENVKIGMSWSEALINATRQWKNVKQKTITDTKPLSIPVQKTNHLKNIATKYHLDEDDLAYFLSQVKDKDLEYTDFNDFGISSHKWQAFMYDLLINLKDIEKELNLSNIEFRNGKLVMNKK